jgi:hypothetical protein
MANVKKAKIQIMIHKAPLKDRVTRTHQNMGSELKWSGKIDRSSYKDKSKCRNNTINHKGDWSATIMPKLIIDGIFPTKYGIESWLAVIDRMLVFDGL